MFTRRKKKQKSSIGKEENDVNEQWIGDVMATILVDYENVCTINGLAGVQYLSPDDTLYIYYSASCEKIRAEYIRAIERSKCHFFVYKLKTARKNALDFYIASETGSLLERGETKIGLISRDKGFESICDYLRIRSRNRLTVVTAVNIENALIALNDNSDRCNQILRDTEQLNVGTEHARINENRLFRRKIIDALTGTEYESMTNEILDYIETNRKGQPKTIYTGSLHHFGRSAGTEIYKILKSVI